MGLFDVIGDVFSKPFKEVYNSVPEGLKDVVGGGMTGGATNVIKADKEATKKKDDITRNKTADLEQFKSLDAQGKKRYIRDRSTYFSSDTNYTSDPGDFIALDSSRDISDHPEWEKVFDEGGKSYYLDVGRKYGNYSWVSPLATVAGTIVGGAIGSIVPGAGTVIGAAIGGSIGAGLGGAAEASAEGYGWKTAAETGGIGLGKGALIAGGSIAGGPAGASAGAALGSGIESKIKGNEWDQAIESAVRSGLVTRASLLGPEFGALATGIDVKTRGGGTLEGAAMAATIAEASNRAAIVAGNAISNQSWFGNQPGLFGTYSGQNIGQDLTQGRMFNPAPAPSYFNQPGLSLRQQGLQGSQNNQLPTVASTRVIGGVAGGNWDMSNVGSVDMYGNVTARGAIQQPAGVGQGNNLVLYGDPNNPGSQYWGVGQPGSQINPQMQFPHSTQTTDMWTKIGNMGSILTGVGGLLGAGVNLYGMQMNKKISEDQLALTKEIKYREFELEESKLEETRLHRKLEEEINRRQAEYLESRNAPTNTEAPAVINF